VAQPLIDTFGRVHRDLRISVTDRCSFRCTYCMPEEGMQWLPRDEVLTFEEIERITRLLVERFGIDSIRLTGGEPLVRAHLPLLVRRLAGLGTDLALTTNGASLRLVAHELCEAGLQRINISLDTLQRDRFLAITRRDALDATLDGIAAAIEVGFDPVKVNAVLMRGVNDDEVEALASWARDLGVVLRFIEFMPLDAQEGWGPERVVPRDEILERLSAVGDLDPVDASLADASQPAERFRWLDGRGEVGIIPTVTHAFCGDCDRLRLTAEGALRNCLFALDETDLRGPLRAGASDDDLAALVEQTVAAKWAGHQIGQVAFIRPRKSMSQIGG
jgi:cyclic pyranopterin phosphate synthase